MSVATEGLKQSAVAQYCKLLRLPTVAGQCSQIAYPEALLIVEVEEREQNVVGRRMMDPHLPRGEDPG